MEKYEELERLQKLKENGTLNNAEFELEKQKILSKDDVKIKEGKKYKKGLAKIFFILTMVGVIITIFLTIFYFYYEDEVFNKNLFSEESMFAKENYNYGLITREEYKEIIDNDKKIENRLHSIQYGAWGTSAITVIFLITGIIFKIKEKGGIKIVD